VSARSIASVTPMPKGWRFTGNSTASTNTTETMGQLALKQLHRGDDGQCGQTRGRRVAQWQHNHHGGGGGDPGERPQYYLVGRPSHAVVNRKNTGPPHFPKQNFEKILPSRSSVSTRPTTSPTASSAARTSSAMNSGERPALKAWRAASAKRSAVARQA